VQRRRAQRQRRALTFPAFTLAAGATCTISYDVTASQQCFGEVSNTVNVTGTFSSACIAKGGSQTVQGLGRRRR
jgi:hypothetical protein